MKEPLLRFIACHRGTAAKSLRNMLAIGSEPPIPRGPLRGCYRYRPRLRSVYKCGRGYVLEFSVVIRPGYPESLSQ